jgi:hypothetical protein
MSEQDLTDKQIAEIIGASSAVPVEGLPAQGPLDLLALRREVQERLQSDRDSRGEGAAPDR